MDIREPAQDADDPVLQLITAVQGGRRQRAGRARGRYSPADQTPNST